MNIIKNKNIFLTLSGILLVASVAALLTFGLKEGIDFIGGTQWEISGVKNETLQLVLPKEANVATGGQDSFIIRLPELSEIDHQKYFKQIKEKDIEAMELSFESIGSSIGYELKKKAIWAFLLVLLGMALLGIAIIRPRLSKRE